LTRRFRFSTLITAATLLGACVQSSTSTPAALPNAQTTPAPVWDVIAPGLERLNLRPNNSALVSFIVLRIDPARYAFRAHYQPGEARSVVGWRDALPDAAALINANFFDRDNRILGLLIADGVIHGQSYRDRGGMFAVDADGAVSVRALIPAPYQGEAYTQAVQAFPVLVAHGEPAFTNTRGDGLSRRTVIAVDDDGYVLWIVSSSLIGLRLTELSAYLPTANLGIVDAFNLDGGGSTLLYIAPDDTTIPSFDAVPAVLAIYPKP